MYTLHQMLHTTFFKLTEYPGMSLAPNILKQRKKKESLKKTIPNQKSMQFLECYKLEFFLYVILNQQYVNLIKIMVFLNF